MDSRVCAAGCGASMMLYRADARACSARCRKRLSRRALPAEMTARKRWVRHTASKRPVTVAGVPASSTNPFTWASHEAVSASPVGVGAGFVLGQGIGCIDLDHCFEGGVLLPWAAELVAANRGTYIEVSMSGDGLHIFGLLAEAPGYKIRDGRSIEVYSSRRYIAVTGDRFMGAPSVLAPLVVPGRE